MDQGTQPNPGTPPVTPQQPVQAAAPPPPPPPAPTVNPVAAGLQPQPQAATGPTVPANWEGAFGVYKYSKAAVRSNLSPFLVTWVVYLVATFAINLVLRKSAPLISHLVVTVLEVYFTIFITKYSISVVRGEKLSLGTLVNMSKSFITFLKMLGLLIILGISLAFAMILFVVPFIIIFPRVILAPYFLVDKEKNLGVFGSVNTSWEVTKGHSGKIWGITGVSILIGLLFITIIGIPFAIYFGIMYSAAFAVAYEFINRGSGALVPAAAQPAAMPPASPDITPPPVSPQPPATPPLVQ